MRAGTVPGWQFQPLLVCAWHVCTGSGPGAKEPEVLVALVAVHELHVVEALVTSLARHLRKLSVCAYGLRALGNLAICNGSYQVFGFVRKALSRMR